MRDQAPAAWPIRQGRLTGPSALIDRRVNAFRDDLADATLAATVIAARYADAARSSCIFDIAMLRSVGDASAIATSSLLFGEAFDIFEIVAGWAWGRCVHDGYVGWVPAAALAEADALPTHRITAAAALVFEHADIKSNVVGRLPLNALLIASAAEGNFHAACRGFIHRRHLSPIASVAADPVVVAEGFVGSPYLWGGRTRDGIDCSGLTQAALLACGIACPRDSDQQLASVGSPVAFADRRRGDLICFPGHVGILVAPDHLLHANAYWMTTLIEPLCDVIDRLQPLYSEPVLGVRRPPCPPEIQPL